MIARKIALALLLLCSQLLIACEQKTLERGFLEAATGLSGARQVATVQYQFGHLDRDSYDSKLIFFRQINISLDALADQIVAFGEINPGNKAAILASLDALIATADELVSQGGLGFKSDAARSAFKLQALLFRAGLRTVRNIVLSIEKPTPISRAQLDRWFDPLRQGLEVQYAGE